MLNGLVVHPSYRGRGWGRSLVDIGLVTENLGIIDLTCCVGFDTAELVRQRNGPHQPTSESAPVFASYYKSKVAAFLRARNGLCSRSIVRCLTDQIQVMRRP